MSPFDAARRSSPAMATIAGAAHTMCPYDSASDDLPKRAGELAGATQGVAATRVLEVLAREARRRLR